MCHHRCDYVIVVHIQYALKYALMYRSTIMMELAEPEPEPEPEPEYLSYDVTLHLLIYVYKYGSQQARLSLKDPDSTEETTSVRQQ